MPTMKIPLNNICIILKTQTPVQVLKLATENHNTILKIPTRYMYMGQNGNLLRHQAEKKLRSIPQSQLKSLRVSFYAAWAESQVVAVFSGKSSFFFIFCR
uniref:Uncharacterized protein n=1 Tax=Arion vulgaris TaxID=1028688 RepID=A0A0B7BWL6_9EUPU